MWLLYALRRRILPVPVILNRLAAVLHVFNLFPICSSFLRRRFLVGADDQGHLLAFKAGRLVNLNRVSQLLEKPIQLLNADFRVRDLSCPKLDEESNLVALIQELSRVLQEDLQVMPSGARTHLYTLNVLRFTLVLVLFVSLFGFVLVLTVVDDAANWRLGVRGNENEVEAHILGHLKRFAGGYDAYLLPFGSYEPDVRMAQTALVDHGPWFGPDVSTSKPSYLASPEYINNLMIRL